MTESVLQRVTHCPTLNNHDATILFQSILTDINQLIVAVNTLRAEYANHVHSGVTVGAGSTGKTTTATAPININTLS